MANLPSQLLSGHGDNSFLDDTGRDLFDSTVIVPTMASTQQTTSNDDQGTRIQQQAFIKKAKLCIEGCKHADGKGRGIGPVQCHLCQHWLHPPCIGENDKEIVNTWTCPACRKLPDMMTYLVAMVISIQKESRLIKTQVTESFSDIQNKLDIHCQQCTRKDDTINRITNALDAQTKELITSTNERADLRKKVTELTIKLNSQTWRQFRSQPKSVVIGSSVIRDISQSRLQNTDVICISGGKISNIKDKVNQLSSDVTREQAILVVGGNDCDPRESGDSRTASDIIEDYRTLVTATKTKAEQVTVSSILPRLKSAEVKTKIDDVNAGLQVMCGEESVNFVDNRNSFHLGDGTVNDGYFVNDGVHLNTKATNKLVQNLQLKLKDGLQSACNPQRQSKTHKHDTSPITSDDEHNNVDTDQMFWSYAKRKVTPRRNITQHTINRDKQRKSQNTNRRHSDSHQDVRCFNCYEENHTANTCRHERPVICHECGEEGHKTKHHSHY